MNISSLSQRIVPGLLAGLFLFGSAMTHAATSLKEPLAPILSGSHRSDANRARDVYRHPVETLSFFGLKPNHTVIEITPGAGWYTEVLAPFHKASGQYIAALTSPEGLSERGAAYTTRVLTAFQEKMAKDPANYDKVKVVQYNQKSPSFGPDGSADMVLTFRNVHNWADGKGGHLGMFKAMYAVLKPGGVLGVVDHRADPKNDFKQALDLGYLPEDFVITELEKIGFKLDGKSDVNNNAKDTKNYEKGVWTLPPVLALKDTDRAKYVAIGESDRFTLRFVKPK